jgi:hypothetical protein
MKDVLSVGAQVREIPWADLALDSLSPEQRARLGHDWRHRMEQEHLAVGAFAMITQELAEVGCDPTVLAFVAKASCDEVRHAEICRRLAVSALGASAVPARVRGTPKIPAHAEQPMPVRALLHAVEMCCLGETCTGVYLTTMHEHATHPTARRALEALLEDEIDHGRMGWALLSTADEASKAIVSRELPAMTSRALGAVLGAKLRCERADEALYPFGYVPNDEAVALYRKTLDDVLVPGFEMTGVDPKPMLELARTLIGAPR